MGKITIAGIDQNGNQQSETIEVLKPNRMFYTAHHYQSLGIKEPGLHFYVQRPNLWKRLLRFFGFGKWKTVVKIHSCTERAEGIEGMD